MCKRFKTTTDWEDLEVRNKYRLAMLAHYAAKVAMVWAAWQFNKWLGVAALMHAVQTTSLTVAINIAGKMNKENRNA
jgi:hypothetical protein